MLGGGAEVRITGVEEIVGSGGNKILMPVGGGGGGGGGGGEGRRSLGDSGVGHQRDGWRRWGGER